MPHDVEQEEIEGVVEAWRRDERTGELVPIPRVPSAHGDLRWTSERLGLELAVVAQRHAPGGIALRAFLPGAATPLPTELEADSEARERALREQIETQQRALREQEQAMRELRARLEELEAGRE